MDRFCGTIAITPPAMAAAQRRWFRQRVDPFIATVSQTVPSDSWPPLTSTMKTIRFKEGRRKANPFLKLKKPIVKDVEWARMKRLYATIRRTVMERFWKKENDNPPGTPQQRSQIKEKTICAPPQKKLKVDSTQCRMEVADDASQLNNGPTVQVVRKQIYRILPRMSKLSLDTRPELVMPVASNTELMKKLKKKSRARLQRLRLQWEAREDQAAKAAKIQCAIARELNEKLKVKLARSLVYADLLLQELNQPPIDFNRLYERSSDLNNMTL